MASQICSENVGVPGSNQAGAGGHDLLPGPMPGQRCNKLGHLGDCSSVEMCRKKVKISCPCKRRKDEFRCSQANVKDKLVACDDVCKEASKHENVKSAKQKEEE